jgi:hypothetical protein
MAKLLTLLFEITALFEMTTRARKLDPQLNMWSTAEPVVGAWIAGKSPAASKPSREPGRARTLRKFASIAGVQYHHIFGDCNFVNANGNPMAPLAPVEEMLIEPNRWRRRRTKDRWTRQALPLQISASGAQPRRRGA